MSKRFQRTKSTTSTQNLSRKPSFHEQEVEELSRSTIIPFVNTRFSVIPKTILNKPSSSQIGYQAVDKNRHLACAVIFYRLNKMVKNLTGYRFLYNLKVAAFSDKLGKFVQGKRKMLNISAFFCLRNTQKDNQKIRSKLLVLNFIFKRQINNRISFAFRKISIQALRNKEQDALKSLREKMETNRKDKQIETNYGQLSQKNIQISQVQRSTPRKGVNSNIMFSTPQTLKPDTYKNPIKNATVWKIVPY